MQLTYAPPAGHGRRAPTMETPTLSEYARHWLASAGGHYRPTTLRGYRSVLACHIVPAIGHVELQAFTRRDVRRFLMSLLAAGVTVGMARMAYAILSALFTAAEEDEWVADNPAHGAARRLFRRAHDRDGRAPSRDEYRALLELSVRRYPHLVGIWTLLPHTGLRPGEAVGLRADDVGPSGDEVTVARTYHGSGRFGPPKNGRTRLVPLNRIARAVVAGQIAASQPPHRWLFGPSGELPYTPNYLQGAFRRLRREAGIRRRLTPHCLRHACATWLIERGAREVEVQRLLGHHSVQLTIDLYARGATLAPIVALLEDGHPVPSAVA